MKNAQTKFILALLATAISCAFGTLTNWDSTQKPKLSLEAALKLVESKINNKIFFCTHVNLIDGSESSSEKKSVWKITYGNSDGLIRVVSVWNDGRCEIDYEKTIKPNNFKVVSVEDAAERVFLVLKSKNNTYTSRKVEEKIIIESQIRNFSVYSLSDSGQFNSTLSDLTGPQTVGFQIILELKANESTKNEFRRDPYWLTEEIPFLTLNSTEKLQLSAKWGLEFHIRSRLCVDQIISSLGLVYDQFQTPSEK